MVTGCDMSAAKESSTSWQAVSYPPPNKPATVTPLPQSQHLMTYVYVDRHVTHVYVDTHVTHLYVRVTHVYIDRDHCETCEC